MVVALICDINVSCFNMEWRTERIPPTIRHLRKYWWRRYENKYLKCRFCCHWPAAYCQHHHHHHYRYFPFCIWCLSKWKNNISNSNIIYINWAHPSWSPDMLLVMLLLLLLLDYVIFRLFPVHSSIQYFLSCTR